jgi:hypothetical protein
VCDGAEIGDAAQLECLVGEGGDRKRRVLEAFLAALCRDQDFLEADSGRFLRHCRHGKRHRADEYLRHLPPQRAITFGHETSPYAPGRLAGWPHVALSREGWQGACYENRCPVACSVGVCAAD